MLTTNHVSQWWWLVMVESPRNMKMMVSLHWASIFTKYLTELLASCVMLPFMYCFINIPQATILKTIQMEFGLYGRIYARIDERPNSSAVKYDI